MADAKTTLLSRQGPAEVASTMSQVAFYALPLLAAAGGYFLWYLSVVNGLLMQIGKSAFQKVPKFPNSMEPMLRSYTGIGPIDYQLTVLVAFFAPVLDGSSTDMTLFDIFGFGQFGAGWTLLVMESCRLGNAGKVISFIGTFGFIFQNAGFALVVPLYLMFHLITSPTAKISSAAQARSLLLIPADDLAVLPYAIAIGYVLPSILMALPAPSMVSYVMHQRFIALWQPFPVWTAIAHYLLKQFTSTATTSPATATAYFASASSIYKMLLTFCIITHIPVVLIALLPASSMPAAYPVLQSLAQSSLTSVFVPSPPLPGHPISSLAEGTLAFFHWDVYIGSAAFMIWELVLYTQAFPKASLVMVLLKLVGWTAVAGPMGALTMLMWERDSIVL